MDELRDKIAKLPVWAREHIADLTRRAAPNNAEVTSAYKSAELANKNCRRAQNRLDAVMEIMQAASRGEHETAKEFVTRVLANWCMDQDGKDFE